MLQRKIKNAIDEAAEHKLLHDEFLLGLDCNVVAEWTDQLASWGKDRSKPNPFEKRFKSKFCMRLMIFLTEKNTSHHSRWCS